MPPKKRKFTLVDEGLTQRAQRTAETKIRGELEAAGKRARTATWSDKTGWATVEPLRVRLPASSADAEARKEEAMQIAVEKYRKKLQTQRAREQESQKTCQANHAPNSVLTESSSSSPTQPTTDSRITKDIMTSVWKQAKSGIIIDDLTLSSASKRSDNVPEKPSGQMKAADIVEMSQDGQLRLDMTNKTTQSTFTTKLIGSYQDTSTPTHSRTITFRATEDHGQCSWLSDTPGQGIGNRWNLRQRLWDTLNDQK